jgi:hypothetical protein
MSLKKLTKSTKPTKEILKRSQTLKVKKQVGKVVIISVLVILLISGLIYTTYIKALSVRSVSVQGNDILESEDIISQVNKGIDGKYWYVFPKKSIFIYPQKTLEVDLLKLFPRLSSVDIGLGEWDSLIVDVRERDSDTIWCKDSESPKDVLGNPIEEFSSSTEPVPGDPDQNCFFSDDEGFIFAPAPYFSNSVFTELSGMLEEQPLAKKYLSNSSYDVVTHFAKNLAKIFAKNGEEKHRLIRVKIIDKNNYEAILADTSKEKDNEWKIFFDNDDTAEDLANNLITILDSEPFKKEMLKNKGNLASIDLRYGKKVFYKFKDSI